MYAVTKKIHPSPDKRRERWLNLNGDWDFSLYQPRYDSTINVPFSIAAPLSGIGKDYKGAACYRKVVRYTPRLSRLFLVIGACDYECRATVNGTEVGRHLGGYPRFEFEVTDVWKKDGENVIEILSIDNDDAGTRNQSPRMYGKQRYGNIRGIWQTIYLEERPSSYIKDFVIRTSMDGTIRIKAGVEGPFDSFSACFADQEASSFTYDDEGNASLTFKVDAPRLWSPDSPSLYYGSLKLTNGRETDEVFTYFGIREVGTVKCENGRRYVALNGRPVFLNATLDQSYNPGGYFTLPSDEECEQEILRMKRLGLNAVRIHVKSEEPLKLYYADKHGLMIIQDIPSFYGDPDEEARALYDTQMIELVKRDINHPAIILWVLFNEAWGLRTLKDGEKVYTKDTQEWVRYNYKRVKALDPTRLVEDNSACFQDHVETDIDSYHFYKNGYEQVKAEIELYCEGAYEGSTQNFIGGNVSGDIPHMNSECGNVWGVDAGIGDSDISWHYKYMINEFRMHDAESGFVFTEFHDVIDEYNGYYRIDNSEKIFGYGDYVPGMTIRDLHAQDFLAYDFAPGTVLAPGQSVSLPLYISSFTNENHGKKMTAFVELAATDGNGKCEVVSQLTIPFEISRYGLTKIGDAELQMPYRDCVVTARLYLKDENDATVMRNFVCFDVEGDGKGLRLPLFGAHFTGKGGLCQEGEKLNCLSGGSVSFELTPKALPASTPLLRFEASAREAFAKDLNPLEPGELDMEPGHRPEPGQNPNSFFQTTRGREYPSTLCVLANGLEIFTTLLPDDPADSRGLLSWMHQKRDNRIDEGGTYGWLYTVQLPEALRSQEKITLTFTSDNGFSLFGRKSGRYPTGVEIL